MLQLENRSKAVRVLSKTAAVSPRAGTALLPALPASGCDFKQTAPIYLPLQAVKAITSSSAP